MEQKINGGEYTGLIQYEEIQVSHEEFERIEKELFPPVREDFNLDDFICFGTCNVKVK